MKNSLIRIGVSACLNGEKVRYDGDHRRNHFVAETLAGLFELVPVCPESELGMGIPRETVDLHGSIDAPRMIGTHGHKDWTDAMNAWALKRIQGLAALNLCGFVFKKGSPSCGVRNVPLIQTDGEPLLEGRGLFVMAFTKTFPEIPIEDELKLEDSEVQKDFIRKVYARHAAIS